MIPLLFIARAAVTLDPDSGAFFEAMLGLGFFWFFIWSIVSIVIAKKINRKMMEKTGTNGDIIRDFLNGAYDNMIPASLNNEAGRMRIYKILSTGMATSMRGAILMARKKDIDRKIGKVALAGTAAAVRAGNRMTDQVWSDFGDAVGGAIENIPNYIKVPDAPQTADRTWQITQEKNKAVFLRTQANNAKAANPGPYNARRAENIANRQRNKADHM